MSCSAAVCVLVTSTIAARVRRQRPLALGVEEPFRLQLRLRLLERQFERPLPERLQASSRRAGTCPAGGRPAGGRGDEFHPVLSA
jgi:hypothetical protein